MDDETVIGLDVGGTKTAVLEGTPQGVILRRIEVPTRAHLDFRTRLPEFVELIESIRREARSAGRHPVALSISIGGPLRIEEGTLIDPPHLLGWHHVNLIRAFGEGLPDLPVFVEHDGNAGALAEFHFGVGASRPALRHLIFLTFGTGMGAGFILNGRILHGTTDTAGEVGHWRLASDGPVAFGKAGSFEGFASGAGLVVLASQRFPHRWSPETSIRALVDDMLADDPDALAVADEAGRWLGRGLALLVDALNPQIIVLGSLAVVLGERILAPARRTLREEALPQAVTACEILPAALGRGIGDIASLMAALTRSDHFALAR